MVNGWISVLDMSQELRRSFLVKELETLGETHRTTLKMFFN
jgi:hypothetical protein